MAADMEIVKSTTGNGWEVYEVTAGSAIEAGDLVVVAADGFFDKVTNAATKVDAIALSAATAQEDTISVVWWTPNIIVRGTIIADAHVGDLVGIDVTSDTIKFEEATVATDVHGRIVNIYDSTNKIVDVMPIIRLLT